MLSLWDEELSPVDEERLLDKLENEISKRKLEVPAIMFFEMYKPWSNIAGNKAIVFSPFIIPFVGYQNVNDYSRLLAKRDNVEKLIQRLEKPKETKKDAKEAP